MEVHSFAFRVVWNGLKNLKLRNQHLVWAVGLDRIPASLKHARDDAMMSTWWTDSSTFRVAMAEVFSTTLAENLTTKSPGFSLNGRFDYLWWFHYMALRFWKLLVGLLRCKFNSSLILAPAWQWVGHRSRWFLFICGMDPANIQDLGLKFSNEKHQFS